MPEASPVRNLKAKMSEAAAPRRTSPMRNTQSQRSPQLDTRSEDRGRRPYAMVRQGRWPELVNVRQLGSDCRGGSLSLEAGRRSPRTQKTQHASRAQSQRSPQPGSRSEDRGRRPNAMVRQGRRPELVNVRQLGSDCRGGPLSLMAGRRSQRTQKNQHASRAPSQRSPQLDAGSEDRGGRSFTTYDRGDGPSLSISDSSGRTVEAARCH